MTKFKSYKKTDSLFNLLDISMEFNESVDFVFTNKNKLIFVLKSSLNQTQTENVKSHLVEYFQTQRGYKCKFAKTL